MLLVVDIGNSQTSFGVLEKGRLTHHWRAETKISRTADEYAAYLFPLLQHAHLDAKTWEGVALCSVVPPADSSFESFSRKYLSQTSFKVHNQQDLGFRLNVPIPSEVGADRLANVAYAVEHLKLPAIVVDIGTAITFDVISAERVYEGGIILPGVKLAVESLGSRTAKLPSVDLRFPPSVIGKNTVQCIQSGILHGYCDLLDGLLTRCAAELKATPEIVLTGGNSVLFEDKLRTPVRCLPDLTLEGIEILYRRNTSFKNLSAV